MIRQRDECDRSPLMDKFPRYFYSPSPPPQEDWGDASADQEWDVNIVSEEIDLNGQPVYEAEWPGWRRTDGSNNTWGETFASEPRIVQTWNHQQQRQRQQLADESLDIEIWGTPDFYHTKTHLRAQAFEEKSARAATLPNPVAVLDAKREALLREKSNGALAAGPSTSKNRSQDRSSIASSSRTPASVAPTPQSSSDKRKRSKSHRKKSRDASASDSSDEILLLSAKKARYTDEIRASGSTSVQDSRSTRLKRLTAEWTRMARSTRAASITFVNEVDDEDGPALSPDFEYLEKQYHRASDVPSIPSQGMFQTCSCATCDDPIYCECQTGLSQLTDHSGPAFAYDEHGRFRFLAQRGSGIMVIECNDFCCCTITCPNRVSQRPRTTRIEIFKTQDRGWGARSPDLIEKGTVLGIYTGTLIPRENKITQRNYIFDLDWTEPNEASSHQDHNKYSVDSRTKGNWTRFLNHSCQPNLTVYSVVSETIPSDESPDYYIAFVAAENVPPYEELTFDYAPLSDPGIKKKKRGETACLCGSRGCRKWTRAF